MAFRVGLMLTASAVVALGLRTSQAAAPVLEDPAALRAYARCQRAMAESTCVATGASAQTQASSAPEAAVVFVAGAGAVPGDVYRQLVRADGRMCDLVRAACALQPQGSVCTTAAKLW
ncbi:hypothetical protein FN976_06805 [Caenimonas sedimenti]|uniref:Secreted protein n=1 Tax=Caenimonas sedimenti TaxID=2596921 RepID=A0A562ZVJ5_9BURK|nr:hypothetical protein [Caenimonas sedimenti]TWO72406.1 hypothetical protein FN976_06805 [Caenimonas sedimenti]